MLRLVSLFSVSLIVGSQGGAPKLSFDGDVDPISRQVSGTITLQANAAAATLQGYRLYSSGGTTDIGNAAHALNLAKSCPVDSANEDYVTHVTGSTAWSSLASADCNNDSPYSPKCVGASCGSILIKAGSDGEYYVTRYDTVGSRTDGSGEKEPYGNNESAEIYLPSAGTLVVVSREIDSGDTLTLDSAPGTAHGTADLTAATVGEEITLATSESVATWTTDSSGTSNGWTLVFTPAYPTVTVTNELMADGAGGFRVAPVNGNAGAATVTTSSDASLTEETGANRVYIETYDWIVPNSTCTPTTMLCPIPNTWAHISYNTPSSTPEPAEGSCTQVSSGSSSLTGCADFAQSTRQNWAGNCGDAESYFWFEKIACGSVRTFDSVRSLILDRITVSPDAADIQAIKDIYYTTKAPENNSNFGGGITYADPDYHVSPVLPPDVTCSCVAAMDAYASLLSVVSETETPDAPQTLDPEVLNTGTSKIVATLRVYNDPTYSIPAGGAALPVVVQRFYVEVSTKFTKNHITISDCTSAHEEALLNDTNALKPRTAYCDNTATFDTRNEGVPSGITHMDRISMKKFKFGSTTDVFLQCKIRACAAKPCGSCSSGRVLQQTTDLSAMEGEMFAPPARMRISPFDTNALNFGPVQATAGPAAAAPAPAATSNVADRNANLQPSAAQPQQPQYNTAYQQPQYNTMQQAQPQQAATTNNDSGADTTTILLAVGCTAVGMLLLFSLFGKSIRPVAAAPTASSDPVPASGYQGKVDNAFEN